MPCRARNGYARLRHQHPTQSTFADNTYLCLPPEPGSVAAGDSSAFAGMRSDDNRRPSFLAPSRKDIGRRHLLYLLLGDNEALTVGRISASSSRQRSVLERNGDKLYTLLKDIGQGHRFSATRPLRHLVQCQRVASPGCRSLPRETDLSLRRASSSARHGMLRAQAVGFGRLRQLGAAYSRRKRKSGWSVDSPAA